MNNIKEYTCFLSIFLIMCVYLRTGDDRILKFYIDDLDKYGIRDEIIKFLEEKIKTYQQLHAKEEELLAMLTTKGMKKH